MEIERITCKGFVKKPNLTKEKEQYYEQHQFCSGCGNHGKCKGSILNCKVYITTDGSSFRDIAAANMHCIKKNRRE